MCLKPPGPTSSFEGGRYDEGDLLAIARRQWAWAHWVKGPAVLDTDLWTLVLWAEVRFGRVDPWLRAAAASQGPRIYLLCEPNLPWVEDPLREHPSLRTGPLCTSVTRRCWATNPGPGCVFGARGLTAWRRRRRRWSIEACCPKSAPGALELWRTYAPALWPPLCLRFGPTAPRRTPGASGAFRARAIP